MESRTDLASIFEQAENRMLANSKHSAGRVDGVSFDQGPDHLRPLRCAQLVHVCLYTVYIKALYRQMSSGLLHSYCFYLFLWSLPVLRWSRRFFSQFLHFLLYRRRRPINSPIKTQAKSMHFAMLIPDWNSLDSVRQAHSELELTAIAFFAFLVVFDILAHLADENKKKERLLEKIGLFCFAVAVGAEIAAYIYGQRNDKLSAAVINSLDVKVTHAQTEADGVKTKTDAIAKQSDALTMGLEAASGNLGKLKRNLFVISPRGPLLNNASPELSKKLLPFAKQQQRFGLIVCGPQNLVDAETLQTAAVLEKYIGR